MRDLRLIGVHEDGQHLLLAGPDDERYTVPLDESLRAAARRDRPRLGQLQIEIGGGLTPRDVQALIRAGSTAEEVADRAGWAVEKVRRYEGPIVAEREHVAGLAQKVRMPGRGGSGGAPTLAARVAERLGSRGVASEKVSWDASRLPDAGWTVSVTFPAGGRQRTAHWAFDVSARTVVATDDEALWLGEDVEGGSPLPAPHLVASSSEDTPHVYDVEAEGGIHAAKRRSAGHGDAAKAGANGPGTANAGGGQGAASEAPLDLMSAMRARSTARTRRGRREPAHVDAQTREDALPLEQISYDPSVMGLPPAGRGAHPDDVVLTASSPVLDEQAAADHLQAPEGSPDPHDRSDSSSSGAAETPVSVDATDDTTVDAGTGARPTAPGRLAEHEELTLLDPPPALRGEPEEQRPETDLAAVARARTERAKTGADRAEEAEEAAARQRHPAGSSARRRGRPSVPSWDDVMFGAARD